MIRLAIKALRGGSVSWIPWLPLDMLETLRAEAERGEGRGVPDHRCRPEPEAQGQHEPHSGRIQFSFIA